MKSCKVFIYLVLFIKISVSSAQIRLPEIFSDNMVLQRDMNIPVWGWAVKSEIITVTLGNQKVTTRALKDGSWKLFLAPIPAGGPYELGVSGKNKITFKNVLVGEVWVCSGQSNMEWPLHNTNHGEEEVKNAIHQDIRFFTVPKKVSKSPLMDMEPSRWEICNPESAAPFSAVGYFFGRKLSEELDVPIGLINTSWGGTIAETWISGESISTDPDFSKMLTQLKSVDMAAEQDRLRADYAKWQKDLVNKDKGYTNGEYTWSEENVDLTGWKTMVLPALWEEKDLPGLDGIVWFVKKFSIPENIKIQSSVLSLGPVDDSDITWINGHKAGEIYNVYNAPRKYIIDPKILKPGENRVVVRVEDYGGGGGLYGAPNEIYIEVNNEKIPLTGEWNYRVGLDDLGSKPASPDFGPNSYPTLLFNGMINPLLPYGIRGAIWYQGESNASRAEQYRRVFPELIQDWRQHWGQGDFPFLFVQLANYMQFRSKPGESEWAELREAQSLTLSFPNTGMASTIDIGDANDIHPRNKQDVGNRLALNAMKIAYGKDVVFTGPTFSSMKQEGNKILLTFNHVGAGLEIHDRYGYIHGFTIAGNDRKFYWAKAILVNENTIEVYADPVESPVAVRYGWSDNPADLNLYNKEGLPANPFRTDNWPGITAGKK